MQPSFCDIPRRLSRRSLDFLLWIAIVAMTTLYRQESSSHVHGFIIRSRCGTTISGAHNEIQNTVERCSSGGGSSSSTRTATALFLAKKKSKSKKERSGGGGFGSSSSAPAATASTTTSSFRGTGSGSKALAKAANNFDRLRKAKGVEACNDVYVRSPLNCRKTFWFVGKIVHDLPSDTSSSSTSTDSAADRNENNPRHQAAIAQKRLILEYAKNQLRPQNLGGKYASTLELWLAPGDSEMNAVRNIDPLEPVKGSAADLDPSIAFSDLVGYNPEIYVGDEIQKGGLRIERDEQGRPTKEVFDINQSM